MRLAWLRRVGGSSSRSRPGGCSARRRPPSQEATRPGVGPGQEAAHHRRGSRPPWPRPRPGGHPHRRRPRPGSRPRHGGHADGRRSRGWRALSAVATSPSSRVRACSRSGKPAGSRQGRRGGVGGPAWAWGLAGCLRLGLPGRPKSAKCPTRALCRAPDQGGTRQRGNFAECPDLAVGKKKIMPLPSAPWSTRQRGKF